MRQLLRASGTSANEATRAVILIVALHAIKHREFAMASGEMTRAEFTAFLTTLLLVEADDDGEEPEDAFDRFSRYNGRP